MPELGQTGETEREPPVDAAPVSADTERAPVAAQPMDQPTEQGAGSDAEGGDLEPPRPQIAPSAVRAATNVPDAPEATQPDGSAELPVPTPVPTRVGDAVEVGDADASGADAGEEAGQPEDAADAADDEDVQAWRAIPLTTRLEALLFAAPAPLSSRKLQKLAGDVDGAELRDALASLSAHYEASERAFVLEEIGGGFQLRTRSELSGLLARLGRKRTAEKLTPAALETLAIVAYRQPVLRTDVEKIRGVASGEVLRTLVEKGMVRVAGRADLPGSPLLYGTTPAFLELFGLRDLKDLPTDRELLR